MRICYTVSPLLLSCVMLATACDAPSPADLSAPVVSPSRAVISEAPNHVITTNPDTFASHLSAVDNEGEVIVWLKDRSEPRIGLAALIAISPQANNVLGVAAAVPGEERRGSALTGGHNVAPANQLTDLLRTKGASVYLKGASLPFLAVRLPKESAAAAAAILLESPSVDFIEANQRHAATGSAGPVGGNGTDAKHVLHHVGGAWDYTRGSGAKIGVMDSGFAGDEATATWHPDGQDYTTYGIKKLGFVDDGGNCTSTQQENGQCLAYDDNGHGTHMAGLIGANDNSIGTVGIAPAALTYSMKVAFNADRPGLSCPWPGWWWDDRYCVEDDDWLAALDWASSNGLDVVSMSFVADVNTAVGLAARGRNVVDHAAAKLGATPPWDA